jgi:type II secretory pathway pseudopilin PulG
VTGRDRIVMMVVGAVAVLAAFWFLAVSPKRTEEKAVDAQITAAQGRLSSARASLSTAQQAKRDYDTDYAAVARLGKAVPVDDNVPSLLYQLQTAAHSSKVDFRALKLNAAATPSAPAAAPSAATPPATTTPPAGGTSTTSSTPPAATPAPATQLAAAALPPGASVGAAGFPTMPFSFTFDGSFFDMEHMLRDVNRFITVDGKAVSVRGRLLGVDGFSLEAGPSGFPDVTATISSTAYLLPADQGLTNGASPAAPAAAGAAPAAATASTGSVPAPPTAVAPGVK